MVLKDYCDTQLNMENMMAIDKQAALQTTEEWNEDEDTMKGRFLTFHLADEDYGIAIEFITEIIGIEKITEVPDMPAYVRGVINLRGRVIPVIDVRTRFNLPPRDYDDRTCVIVVQLDETSIGLVVDTVNEVIDIPEDQIAPPPTISQGASGRYLEGLGKQDGKVIILLNARKLLFEEELEQLAQ